MQNKSNGRQCVCLVMFSLCTGLMLCDVNLNNRYIFKVTQGGKHDLFQGLKKYNFTEVFQVTPTTFIFEYNGNQQSNQVFNEVQTEFRHQIIDAEPARVYRDTLKPEDIDISYGNYLPNSSHHDYYDATETLGKSNLVCSNYYGFNVSEVWSSGITGKGVTVAVVDVGINTKLIDLKENINKTLSYNFLTGDDNVTPGDFSQSNYADKAVTYTNHGNSVASVVAATKGNEHCSAGIAYNATIVAIKIFNVTFEENPFHMYNLAPTHWTTSLTIVKAFAHSSDDIDIYVNAWAATKMFDPLDLATKEALQNGANTGRKGLGNIYVVPAGPAGNQLTNNINTITVNAVGPFGSLPQNTAIDASAITSGLEKGNNLSAESMVTTSHGNTCVASFKGVSAATAQIGGIISLGLQANPSLTKRDVDHLLVHASVHEELQGKNITFSRNGAGLYYQGNVGFGLLNAWKFVNLAKQHKALPKQLSKRHSSVATRFHSRHHIQVFEFCHSCEVPSTASCLTKIEYVEVTIRFKTKTNYLRMELISPHRTSSALMHQQISKKQATILSTTEWRKLVSVHFWDESAFGTWRLKISSHQATHETNVITVFLTLYGTRDESQILKNNGTCLKSTVVPGVIHTTRSTTTQPMFCETKPTNRDKLDSDKLTRTESFCNFMYVAIGALCFCIAITFSCIVKRLNSSCCHV